MQKLVRELIAFATGRADGVWIPSEMPFKDKILVLENLKGKGYGDPFKSRILCKNSSGSPS
jgi:hypothetical protein